MRKNSILLFFLFFFLFILVAYGQPVFFPDKIKMPVHTVDQLQEKFSNENIPDSEVAKILGKTVDGKKNSFIREAERVVYQKGKVIQIELCAKIPQSPFFKDGETLSDVSEQIIFHPTLSLDHKREHFIVEMNDVQMNYQPLLKFKNGNFAILDFSIETGKLQKVTYLTSGELLRESNYTVTEMKQ